MSTQNHHTPEKILRVEDVTVSFDGFLVLKDLNFSIERGELRVVIGPNGAGKTTLLDVITGKVRPAKGRALFQPKSSSCQDVTKLTQERIALLGVGRKFQTPNIFKSQTVLDNLHLSAKASRRVLPNLIRFSRNGSSRIDEVLETIGLAPKASNIAGLLAHGEKQWLELGMVMLQDPELLLIDEPVAGMTPRESEKTGELLMSMAKKHTLLVIEHDMTFVRQIAQTVTVLDEGQILCEGTVDEVQRDPKVIQVYLGPDRELLAT